MPWNLTALTSLSGQWIDRVHGHRSPSWSPAEHGPAIHLQLPLSGGQLDDAPLRRGQGRVAPR